jgi:hypothetical protein
LLGDAGDLLALPDLDDFGSSSSGVCLFARERSRERPRGERACAVPAERACAFPGAPGDDACAALTSDHFGGAPVPRRPIARLLGDDAASLPDDLGDTGDLTCCDDAACGERGCDMPRGLLADLMVWLLLVAALAFLPSVPL